MNNAQNEKHKWSMGYEKNSASIIKKEMKFGRDFEVMITFRAWGLLGDKYSLSLPMVL